LAKSLNCLSTEAPTPEPCGQCDVCKAVIQGIALDVVEIDAASNTGVDNIRELIERAQFAPVQCRYKLYVLDEVHMLSTAAFNALLKTLEEPPNRVVFVLATTDPQRVLPTIISRCQRFDFRRIPLPSMVKHLSYISAEESIQIEPAAIQLVAQISQGGLRDAESLLDQLSLQADTITVETVWDLVGAVPERDLLNLVRAIAADDSTALLERVRHLMDKGREPLIVLQSLVGFYRDLLIAKRAPSRKDLVAITAPTWAEMTDFAQRLSAAMLLSSQQKLQSAEVQVKNTTQPRLWLEITLTGLLPSALSAATDSEVTAAKPISRPINITPPPIVTPAVVTPTAPVPQTKAAESKAPVASTPQSSQPPQSVSADALNATVEPSVSLPVIPTEPTKHSAEKRAAESKPAQANSNTPANSENLTSPAKSASSTNSSEPPAVAFGNLADLWKKILAVLQPRGTQMLMTQQGVLLGFDGIGAKVGFRSAPLQKAARERVPNLEAAFQEIFQRPIKISLEVVSAPETTESEPAASPSEPKPARTQSPVPRQIDIPDNTSSDVSNGESNSTFSPESKTERESLNNSQTAPERHKPTSSLPSDNAPNPRLDAPANMQFPDQDQEKIKRFANFFNGQIVDLDGDTDSPVSGPSIPEDSNQTGRKSSDPGPDVPF
jgi:DNA polymerase-3 subunit gamma/tau